jgi:hypothetical protein
MPPPMPSPPSRAMERGSEPHPDQSGRIHARGSEMSYYAIRGSLLEFAAKASHYKGDDCLTWPFRSVTGGYGTLNVSGKKIPAHRYVCMLAHGDPPSPDLHAAHTCGKGAAGCVNPRHLEWKTVGENALDKITHGTQPRGCGIATAKLTEDDVREIRLLLGTLTQREIAKRFGVGQSSINELASGKTWGWVE